MCDTGVQPPLAVVVPGSPVITQFQCIVEGTNWIVPLGFAPESIVVFLTFPTLLNPGTALGIYLAREDDRAFAYVGHLSNTAPSAILRVPSTFINIDSPVRVLLGVSTEREVDIANLDDATKQQQEQDRAATKLALSERLAEDLYNFVTSYGRVVPAEQNDGKSEEAVFLPMSFVDRWRERVMKRMRKELAFWS
ncbi:Overproducer of inositol protein 10 homolog, putative [Trypanosoma equiperdum]|uniref:Uncharacterized protein n=3 Tax=Trypanozoon TaxID=39700 RepID=Q4GZ79_TRYB2|nr:hypothetical protein, conserved [Trypanosoma brucei brucei TREU927]XP_011771320.1 hypothetical protein, conserved [Trypanosoma brucei gambiense DAL972]CAJ16101.1 hypothetical protein, conserved [Trypanosoma brucei brucei TREU927]CBH08879.1 hypothetical protein, conserved [Trypanosoma brucei gambiense DAL972]SCU64497.1 Overproducer of inositol protein 10 homolog, putative [Trypanosoma equiperdum]|eukprot:XP_011771320.1 hypothetical protein, conserved [Trypanosoma brucei gambiense DAL972]